MKQHSLLRRIYFWYRERYFWKLKKQSVKEIFSDIYKNNDWGGEPGEFYSGDGTYSPNIPLYVNLVESLIKEKNIQSVLDIGCGDFRVMSQVVEKVDINYTGADVVPDLIKRNQEKFANARIQFMELNAVDDELPKADLVTIRQVLQHLSNDQITKILGKLKAFKYVLITEHVLIGDDVVPNYDKIPGPHIRSRSFSGVFIDQPPFNIKNSKVVLDIREDEPIKGKLHPAMIRSYLVENK
ncbi:Methyltransferase domain-containing protein [Chitinophaga sp. YR627]|uniref:class I SAM-dependent methyltransferase n=1 Tax=Chitinophaga sp. YR627 TaxID=1881041 RepID=UPI0008E821EE|nr:class I SAM-dependent methyltransferase [Chitinophaga sp. YR627]SFN17855.1 Methyltransferase domain-containing protein [Chitinophaga sp. YR627]